MTYAKQTWADGVAGGTPLSAARLQHIEDGIQTLEQTTLPATYEAVHVAQTGDHLQTLIDAANAGDTITIPSNVTLSHTAGVTVNKKLRIKGAGTLEWTAGIDNAPAIHVTADGVRLQGFRTTNPNSLGAATGGKSFGVLVSANECVVTRTTIDTYQNGIGVDAGGEYYGIRIIDNRVKDVIGAGGGRGSASTNGEDRGDGIVCWGAEATIAGNIVNSKTGSDSRIGIHAEALAGGGVAAPHSDGMVTVTGNVIWGQFRRSIAFESMAHCIATGNTVADATWWSLAISGTAVGCQMSNNTVYWTRQTADDQGSAWGPDRVPLMILGGPTGCKIANNTVRLAGVADALAMYRTSGVSATDCAIDGNLCTVESGSTTYGGFIDAGAVNVSIGNNTLRGFTNSGVRSFAPTCRVEGNTMIGTAATNGYWSDNIGAGQRVNNNTIDGCTTGIALLDAASNMASGNTIKNATNGVDLFGTTDTNALGNVFITVTNHYVNAGGAGNVTS